MARALGRASSENDKEKRDGELANSLWSLSNIVTAFAAVQSLAFTLTILANREVAVELQTESARLHIWYFIAVAALTILLSIVIWIFYKQAMTIVLDSSHRRIWFAVTCMRISAIIIFCGIVLVVLVAFKRDPCPPTNMLSCPIADSQPRLPAVRATHK